MGRKRIVKDVRYIDYWKCPYCGHKNDPFNDVDLSFQPSFCKCDECGKESEIWGSVEYLAIPHEGVEE